MPKRPRRVVTGHDAEGRSVVLMYGESPYSFFLEKAGGLRLTELWETRSSPADNSGAKDAAGHERRIEPVDSGTVFRIIEYPPDSVRLATIDPESFYSAMGAQAAVKAERRPTPGMQGTRPFDSGVGPAGEFGARGAEGGVLLREAAARVRRAPRHAWSNRTEKPCVIAFVLVAATPLP